MSSHYLKLRPRLDNRKLLQLDQAFQKRRLRNGLTAIHVPDMATNQFFVGMTIGAGTRSELEAHVGISHFLEHMMFRGSKAFPKFTMLAEEFEWLGGEWNAATSYEHTEYWYSGIKQTAEDAIRLFAEFLENPLFGDIEAERQVILRELEGELNEYGHSTDLDFHIANLFWPNTSMAFPIVGTTKSISGFTPANLKDYRDRFYIPSNMVICVVGGDENSRFLDLVEEVFEDHRRDFKDQPRPSYPPLPRAVGPHVKWIEHGDNQFSIQLSFISEGEWSPKARSYEIINRILADGFCSRLSKRLREELGLVYSIQSDSSLYKESGCLDITADVAPHHLAVFFEELFQLIIDFTNNGPSEDELERARLRTFVDLELATVHPENIATRLSWAELCQQRFSLIEEWQKVEAISAQEIRAISKELFTRDNLALVILGPDEHQPRAVANKMIQKYF